MGRGERNNKRLVSARAYSIKRYLNRRSVRRKTKEHERYLQRLFVVASLQYQIPSWRGGERGDGAIFASVYGSFEYSLICIQSTPQMREWLSRYGQMKFEIEGSGGNKPEFPKHRSRKTDV